MTMRVIVLLLCSIAPLFAQTREDQIAAVRKNTQRYLVWDSAVADGYKLFGREGPMAGEHWYRKELVDKPLDLAHPSTLQYAMINGERRLIGVAYTIYERPGEALPEGFVGEDDAWHVHDVDQLALAVTRDRPLLRAIVKRRIAKGKTGAGDGRNQLTMLHAWIWQDNPKGMFTLEHTALPYLRAGLPTELAASADEFAPWGVALLDPRACDWEIGRVKFEHDATKEQLDRLRNACRNAALVMKESAAREPHDRLNAAASQAWRSYLATRDSVFPSQEHSHHH
ncbi:MAG TPA: hypothetical protein VM100_12020 [Longimicrobiales bacterium]|nr:hypothetical protein [Longimicrobiales bacterium]